MSDKENSETASGLCAGCGRKYDVLYRKGRLYYCKECLKSVKFKEIQEPISSLAGARIKKGSDFGAKLPSKIIDKRRTGIKKFEKPIATKKRSISGKVFLLIIIIGVSCLIYAQYKPSLYDFQKYFETTIESFNKGVQNLKETIEEVNKPVDLKEVEILVLNYTNIERKKHGLKELVWDEKLVLIAREHSEDMVENDFFSHTNLKGEDPTERARRHGYKLYKDLGGGWYSEGIAENIGKMPTGNVLGIGYVSNDADSIAKAQVQSWMESSGHRENILNPRYDRMGVGVAYDGKYYFLTQNFW